MYGLSDANRLKLMPPLYRRGQIEKRRHRDRMGRTGQNALDHSFRRQVQSDNDGNAYRGGMVTHQAHLTLSRVGRTHRPPEPGKRHQNPLQHRAQTRIEQRDHRHCITICPGAPDLDIEPLAENRVGNTEYDGDHHYAPEAR